MALWSILLSLTGEVYGLQESDDEEPAKPAAKAAAAKEESSEEVGGVSYQLCGTGGTYVAIEIHAVVRTGAQSRCGDKRRCCRLQGCVAAGPLRLAL